MKEWYLLNAETRPNSTGGFENESFIDYKEDAFFESLQTDIATTVTLYNCNRTEQKDIRCIIQDNTASTQLKSMERCILAPIGTLKAGMYILYENVHWLISGYPGNNKIYEKATIILCQYILKWQDNSGEIIERPANFTSAAKYDTGTGGNQTIILSSNTFTVWIPDDDISASLDGKRVFIDRNITNPKKVYKITRSDDVLYLFGEDHGGILSFIADKEELNLIVDRPDLGICDYISPTTQPVPPDETTNSLKISYIGNPELKAGGNKKAFTGLFFDGNGNQIVGSGNWDVIVIDELTPFIQYSVTDNMLKIQALNEESVLGGMVRIIFTDILTSLSVHLDLRIVNSY